MSEDPTVYPKWNGKSGSNRVEIMVSGVQEKQLRTKVKLNTLLEDMKKLTTASEEEVVVYLSLKMRAAFFKEFGPNWETTHCLGVWVGEDWGTYGKFKNTPELAMILLKS